MQRFREIKRWSANVSSSNTRTSINFGHHLGRLLGGKLRKGSSRSNSVSLHKASQRNLSNSNLKQTAYQIFNPKVSTNLVSLPFEISLLVQSKLHGWRLGTLLNIHSMFPGNKTITSQKTDSSFHKRLTCKQSRCPTYFLYFWNIELRVIMHRNRSCYRLSQQFVMWL